MYGTPVVVPVPVLTGVSLAVTGFQTLLLAEIAIVLIISGLVLLRMVSMKRRRALIAAPVRSGGSR